MAKACIVIIEDEPQVREMVSEVLSSYGYEAHGAPDGYAGLRLLKQVEADCVLLDVGLPGGLNGMAVCRQIRDDADLGDAIGIIALTGQVGDHVEEEMFDAGADDYIRKPNFKPKLLIKRLEAVLRRIRPVTEEAIRLEHLTLDPDRRESLVGGNPLSLTPTEFHILYLLASNPDRAIPRRELLDRGGGAAVDRTVDVHVNSIRKKLGRYDWLVETVWGVGYRLGRPPEGWSA